MSTYTSAKYALTAANGDDPILNGDNQMRGLADAADIAFAGIDGQYRLLAERSDNNLTGLTSGTTYLLPASGSGSFVAVGGIASGGHALYLDPAWLLANSRTVKYRLHVNIVANSVAATSTFTFGLYPVATWGGGSGAAPTVATVGAVTAGSTVAFAAPTVSVPAQGNSGDFTAPSAGYFVLAVAITTASMAANSTLAARIRLQGRLV